MAPPVRAGFGEPINILLVDDEPKNLTVLETILNDPGYRLVRAETADQALLALVAQEFALIVLDIQMPGMNGFELAQMIKQRKKTSTVPIIFLTAYYSEDQHVLEGYETGAVDYLHKPVKPTILRSKVAVFAELHRKTRESALANRVLLAEAAERRRFQEKLLTLNSDLEQRVEARTAELLHANRALRESEQRLELALEGAELGVWDWNLVTGTVQYDTRCTRMLGFSVAEVISQSQFWEERIHPSDLPEVRAALEAHLADRAPHFQVQHRLRHKDGRWIWILARGRVVACDETGRPLRACGTHMDITARKLAEEALKRSEAFARSVVESSADCVQVFSLDGQLQWMNENAKQMLEVGGSHGCPSRDLLSFWESGVVRAEAEAALEAARGTGVGRFRGSRGAADGTRRWWDVLITPIAGPEGMPEQLLAVSRDVTEQRRGEEALKEAARRKDEFLAMLSHELRNPLAPLRNAIQILRLQDWKDPNLLTVREMIERQVMHLVRLVDDLLDVSRVSRGKIQLRKEPFELAVAVRQAEEMSRSLISSRRHEFLVTLPEEPVPVEGDITRLTQVISNLIDNAAKYTDEGGKVWLTLERQSNKAVLRVRDTGRGLDAETMKEVFDLFYQADRNLDRADGGLGIGLSLVKSLVQMHGGTVEAHSDGRGKGSEFVVFLPCLPFIPLKPADSFASPPTPARRARVLVVDDNHDSAESMALLLQAEGHAVLTAHDGKKALEISLRECPDLILLDIGLPGLNGYQACQAMRAGGLKDALIIAMTGYGQEEDRELSQQAGFDAHYVKPVDVQAIRDLLVQWTGRGQLRA
jgi:PAS domain S-box-containing protein